MKIIISESQNKNLKLSLKQIIKSVGIESAFQSVGGSDILFEILDINSPMKFLHLFDDLDEVQSEEEPDWTLFRYRPKHNILIYNRKNKIVYINYYEILSVLQVNFDLKNFEIEQLIKHWLSKVYNLRGVIIRVSPGTDQHRCLRSII